MGSTAHKLSARSVNAELMLSFAHYTPFFEERAVDRGKKCLVLWFVFAKPAESVNLPVLPEKRQDADAFDLQILYTRVLSIEVNVKGSQATMEEQK